jgi:hypothetical protein
MLQAVKCAMVAVFCKAKIGSGAGTLSPLLRWLRIFETKGTGRFMATLILGIT